MKEKRYLYTKSYIRQNRSFPIKNLILLILFVVIQLLLILVSVKYDPQPQDIIRRYQITAEPLEDGSLDILYSFLWEPLDPGEPLTWVQIGMANENFTIDPGSLSDNIASASREIEDGYCYANLYFKKSYSQGETFSFSFKVNQKDMLCRNTQGNCLYEFIPGWFNTTPVEEYSFRWKRTGEELFSNGAKAGNDFYTWSGTLACGEYVKLQIRYPSEAFEDADLADYLPFTGAGAYNELESQRRSVIFLCIVIVILLLLFEITYLDSFISYHRGRGFLSNYGHPVHTYGRRNPRYEKARSRYGGGTRGGGCACACACACAGGGRAGCSQKDGVKFPHSPIVYLKDDSL